MGFKNARKTLIEALEEGDYRHEPRAVLSEKNLLAIGEVTEEEVIGILRRTRGYQYSSSPHAWDAEVTVHVFRPVVHGQRWYVKAYFLGSPNASAVFISVHT